MVKIKAGSAPLVSRALEATTGRGLIRLQFFLELAVIDSEGFLSFKASEDGLDSYAPDPDNDTVPALSGKWYEAERVARWLRRYSEKGGRIVLHSNEGDGAAWGWEFDGKGRMRPLDLVPVGKWE
ncbi:MAG: hypothetical protein IPI73_18850 [Betaproteobacteria bacterium]|nr:hypothetical protein [Betaproteobacteria bacterium]